MARKVHVETVFAEAIEIVSPQERAAFLDRACQEDPGLRQEVEKLVVDYFRAGEFLEQPVARIRAPTVNQPVLERPGTQIGPYKLLQVIGEGGMGTVFMAEQTEPVQRRVALKVIKPGMDSQQVLARFDAEKQALAMMDHVNIARVLDAGATQHGRPYFVMELVRGVPITTYCDDNHLTPRERLQLFLPVCQAIQHAHQKGIIHRDIKPSNVMVTLYDGRPVPKVIDFGVAKATEQRLTERTQFTQYGTTVGTLEYMSPEQAEMSAEGIDTRSDIYSLGVLLYELLTGSTPLSGKRMQGAAHAEILRLIKEEVPPKPSTRLTDSGEALASICAQRDMEPARLTKLVRGELDWIVMKTVEKDRNRRYATANGLAADLQRYLNDEPVVAGPPSAGYRFHKFIRRNKSLVLAASLVVLALMGGVIGTTWESMRAVRAEVAAIAERDQAETARRAALASAEGERQAREEETRQRQVAEAAGKKAAEEAAIARAVTEFITADLLSRADPHSELERGLTVEEVLHRASRSIDQRFEGKPLVEAAIRTTIGLAYKNLGAHAAAARHLERAQQLCSEELGDDHVETLDAAQELNQILYNRGQYYEARTRMKDNWERYQRVLGPDARQTLGVASQLADAEIHLGRYDEAEKLLLPTFEARCRLLGEGHVNTLGSMHDLALLYLIQGQWVRAERWLRRALEAPRPIRGLEPLPPRSIMYFPQSPPYHAKDQYIDGKSLLIQLLVPWLESTAKVNGAEDPDTLTIMNILAMLYHEQGRDDEAEPLLIQVLETRRRVFGAENPDTLSSLNDLAFVYHGKRQIAEAEPLDTQYVTSARMYQRTFSLAPKRTGVVTGAYRYNAACAATLVGCESGGVEPELNELERSRWREQARSWLSEDLKYWTQQSGSSRLEDLRQVATMLEYWLHDPDLAGLRDAARIAQLPGAERSSCEQLWAQVNSLLALVQEAISSHSSRTSTDPIHD